MYNFGCIALTGATSTIGTAIIRECIKENIRVLAFINRNSKNESRIPDSELITKIYCGLDEMSSIDVTGLKADAMIHLAWGHTNSTIRNEAMPQIDNIRYSLDSVDLANRLGCATYVGAGSQAEYGSANELLVEDTSTRPSIAYGMAKLCSGQMTRLQCKKYGIKHIWPRILSTYGPYSQRNTIVNYTIECLKNNEVPELTKCEQIWDFIYVDDAARAMLLLADKGKDGEIYIVSSGESRAMKEYIELIKQNMNSDVQIGYGKREYGNNPIMYLCGDISKLKRDTGFKPMVNFEEGIQRTINWVCNGTL